MRDILAGGEFRSAATEQQILQCGRKRPRRQTVWRDRRPNSGRRGTPAKVAVQPGQLASPLLTHGFPSLLMH